MIYGLISDIHANLEAFEAVLAELAGVEAYLCLGDIVGYGPDPSACVRRVQQLPGLACVVGNHDLAAAGRYDLNWFNPLARQAIVWTAGQLSAQEKSYLAALPLRAEAAGAMLVHGALPNEMDYVTTAEEAVTTLDAFSGALCLIGHTHVAEHYRNRPGTRFCEQIAFGAGGHIALEPHLRYLVNPGSIGQPRDGDPRASFGTYDTEKRRIEVRRVPYDIKRVQARMRGAGLPGPLIERLARGR
jgi:diadenosine tetraphosphatase ApaH/serine/threonine PP2A family protein phosphatase